MANWNTGGPGYYPQQAGMYGAPSGTPNYGPPPPGNYPYMGQPPMQPGFMPNPGFIPQQSPPYSNPEAMYGGTDYGDNKAYMFSDITIRNGFIRKVYSILMLQLMVSFSFVALCAFHSGVKNYMIHSPGLMIIAFVIMFATLIALSCCENVRRKSPTNIIVLGLFTLAESFLLGVTAATTKPDLVVMAVGITAIICFSLTLFAFQTTIDFTGCGAYLFIAAIVLMLLGLIAMFFPQSRTINLVYGALGALLFSFYLIYDTQMMIGGNHKCSISPEEYIFAALSLYLDIIQIFMFILQILRATDD